MPCHLFVMLPLLFFLLLMYCTCGILCADNTEHTKRVDLFVQWVTKIPESVNDKEPSRVVHSFASPFLVCANGVMATLVEAVYSKNGNANNDIVARYIGTQGRDWAKNITEGNGDKWTTQLVMQNEEASYIYDMRNPIAVAKDNKIYLLIVNYKRRRGEVGTRMKLTWDFNLAVGEVKPVSEAQGIDKTIEWRLLELTLCNLIKEIKDYSLSVLPYDGSALLTRDGNILFVLEAVKGNKAASVIIHLNDTGEEMKLNWSYVETADGCYSSNVFDWEGKLIMLPPSCPFDTYEVKESTDMGKTWTNTVETVARVWSNLQGKRDFTTATIENKTVLLFTQQNDITVPEVKYEIRLWFADTNRVHYAGLILSDNVSYVVSRGLLYTNGELFSLHQEVGNTGPDNIFLWRLTDKLESIKSVLKTWAKTDEYLLKSCKETAPQGVSWETLCITPMPTNGLVGFLSNTSSGDNIWHDEYLFMNATVKGGTKVKNGFMFRGANAGAQWPIGKHGVDQRYNFTLYGLTVVATVTIHEVPEADISLLTIGKVENEERLGMWYSKDKQWKITSGRAGTFAGAWEINKACRVTLVMRNSGFSAYVDGKLVFNFLSQVPLLDEPLDNQHIFIGGYEEDGGRGTASCVTVTNVLLYNRILNATEMDTLGWRLRDG